MIVDSSAWVEFLRATGSREHLRIKKALQERSPLLLCSTVLQEVLQGAKNAKDALLLESGLSSLQRIESTDIFAQAHLAHNCMHAAAGQVLHCAIAALAIETGQALLHGNRDFGHIAVIDSRLIFV